MKAKDFVQVLRKLIREEVRAAVRQEVKEIMIESVHRAAKLPIEEKVVTRPQPQQQKQSVSSRFNTGNSMLDEVLAETIVPRGFGGENGPMVADINEFGFTSNDVPTAGLSSMLTEEDLPVTSQYSDPTMQYVKDYSAVLKKADQISNGR